MGDLGYIYVAGPMTGLPDFNYPAFRAAARQLRENGWSVYDPTENDDGSQGKPWDFYLRASVRQVSVCNAIALLPGWEDSKGANLELYVAMTLGMKVYFYIDGHLVPACEDSHFEKPHLWVMPERKSHIERHS